MRPLEGFGVVVENGEIVPSNESGRDERLDFGSRVAKLSSCRVERKYDGIRRSRSHRVLRHHRNPSSRTHRRDRLQT